MCHLNVQDLDSALSIPTRLNSSGEPIPRIQYTKEEQATWKAVFNTVLELMPKHFCIEYQRVFALLQKEGIFRPDKIPQLDEMSDFLKRM